MKTLRSIVALTFLIFTAFPSIAADGGYTMFAKAGPAPGRFISMDFQDANLKDILKIFSQQSGLNFVASENIKDRTVTIYFDNVIVEDALNHIMNANNLIYEQEPGSSIFIVKESGKPAVETITKIYELKYAQLVSPSAENGEGGKGDKDADILTVVQGIISENGKVMADKRSNSLIIKDVPSQFAVIEDVLFRLDSRTPQVMIEAEIIETKTTVADKLGVAWGTSGTMAVYTGPVANTIWPLRGKFSKDNATGEGIATGTFSLTNLTATIKAILSDKDTRVLARPRVLTLNSETAKININSNDAIEWETSYETLGNEYIPRLNPIRPDEEERPGVSLKVTPTINKDGFITMTIEPKLITKTEADLSTTANPVYDLNFRTAELKVMVSDGETVVIGGLISRNKEELINKVPFLGDIPLLGAAFRYKATDEVDKELLIFITPHIVKETSYVLGNISEREQEKPKAIREEKIKNLLDLLGG